MVNGTLIKVTGKPYGHTCVYYTLSDINNLLEQNNV